MKVFILSLFFVVFYAPNFLWAQEGVLIHADPRLATLTDALKPKINTTPVTKHGAIYSARGYRVQIYNGNDRHKATSLKIDFIRRYPSMSTYMTYIQPQFRVKVGNFRTRNEAKAFLEQINNYYSPVMIVPDIIVINTFKNDSNN